MKYVTTGFGAKKDQYRELTDRTNGPGATTTIIGN